MSLQNKNVLLGVTASIAAYKSAEIIRQLQKSGASVKVIMTPSATKFITPLTLHALSGHSVYQQDLVPDAAMLHIDLARWADLIVIAPASADFISQLAVGSASSLLASMCLAASVPVFIAPAMNQAMWSNQATQHNIATLSQQQINLLPPESGVQACGEVGVGRMMEPVTLVKHLQEFFNSGELAGKNVLITAGPTHEYIDPVRYLSNASSGKMGFALAVAAIEAGANVTLVSGPVALDTPKNCNRIDVISAAEMLSAVMENLTNIDIFIASAAVADYRPCHRHDKKITKTDQANLELTANPDILASVAKHNQCFCVGFAAQTHDVEKNARAKLERKKLDLIIANDVSRDDIGMGSDDNQVMLIYENNVTKLEKMPKSKLARILITHIADKFLNK